MTIRISMTNPAEHQPNELRALATLFNNLAADREAGRIVSTPEYRSVGDVVVATHNVPGAVATSLPGSTTDAPGASDGATGQQAAVAQDGENTSEVDSAGVKWDGRIHSETKSKNADMTWRKKRGVEQSLVDQVLAEQQAVTASDDTPPPLDDEAPDLPEDDAPELPEEEETPPPVVVADVKPADVIKFITANKLDTATVNSVLASMETGLTKAADLFAKADQAPAALAMLETLVG